MNGLYLELALRLALNRQGGGAASAAQTEMGFLRTWFDVPGDESLLQPFDDGSSLVRERLSTYAALNGTFPAVEGFAAGSAWCGDQA